MVADDPRQIGRDAPVWILARRGSANAERIVAAVGPFIRVEGNEKTAVLVHVFEAQLLQWIEASRMSVLLSRVHGRPPGVASPDIQQEFRSEDMRPAATVVASFAIAGCR